MSLLLGAHCIDTGGIPMAARRAGKAGMQSLQIFSAIPNYTSRGRVLKTDGLTFDSFAGHDMPNVDANVQSSPARGRGSIPAGGIAS